MPNLEKEFKDWQRDHYELQCLDPATHCAFMCGYTAGYNASVEQRSTPSKKKQRKSSLS